MITNIILAILVVGVVYLIFKKEDINLNDDGKIIEENARLKAEVSQKDKNIGQIAMELQSEKTQKDELSGKNKRMFVEITNLKAKNTSILTEKEDLVKEVSNFKATEERKNKEFDDKIQKLEEAKLALEDERKRVRREDEEKIQSEKEERNRMWAEHEEVVKVKLTELCKTPQYAFQYYDNNNLPNGFGGKFKPDFLIEFLEQYVIFDAKVSESDLQGYINNNVKSTVEKINNNPNIYPMVFFIVPTDTIKSLKKTHFYEQGYNFFVISPEAIEIILASLKKITSYELAEQLDPRDRENIVNLIAEFDYHINMRNALDILASESGVSVLKKADSLRNDIKEEIFQKKGKMRLQQFTPTDIKTLMVSTETQREKIDELVSPKVAISEDTLKKVRPVLGKKNKK
ncbi:MAG: hypothetical protein WDK96_00085 [Candidatus Paceibacterota bacterium]|jgi:hypothetical protein